MHINDFLGGVTVQSKFQLNTINNNNNKIEKAGTMWKRLVRALTQSKVYIQ